MWQGGEHGCVTVLFFSLWQFLTFVYVCLSKLVAEIKISGATLTFDKIFWQVMSVCGFGLQSACLVWLLFFGGGRQLVDWFGFWFGFLCLCCKAVQPASLPYWYDAP